MIAACLLFLAAVTAVRLIYLVSRQGKAKATGKRTSPCATLVVLGSGGHTAEMLQMLGGLRLESYKPRIYLTAEGDAMSVEKAKAFEAQRSCHADIRTIPRARKVLQSYWSSVFTTLNSLADCVPLVVRAWPDLLLCNGPGTCIPVCAVAFFIKFCGLHDVKLVYVESFCRVEGLSLSGKLLYYVADYFVVQWPELQEKYPRATYIGRIV